MKTTLNKIAKSFEPSKNKCLIVSPDIFEELFCRKLNKEDLMPTGTIDGDTIYGKKGIIKVYADWSLSGNDFRWDNNIKSFPTISLSI